MICPLFPIMKVFHICHETCAEPYKERESKIYKNEIFLFLNLDNIYLGKVNEFQD